MECFCSLSQEENDMLNYGLKGFFSAASLSLKLTSKCTDCISRVYGCASIVADSLVGAPTLEGKLMMDVSDGYDAMSEWLRRKSRDAAFEVKCLNGMKSY